MIESGKIVKTSGDRAVVRIDKKDECSKCGMCLFPKNANHLDIDAVNSIGAKEGDIVEQGNHETLLAQNGFYAELYNSQFTQVV